MSAKAVAGCYDLNPFNFQKRWIKKATSQSLGNDIPQQSTTRIEQRLEKLAKENQEYKETQMKLMAQLAQLAEDNLIDLDDYHRLLELQKSS